MKLHGHLCATCGYRHLKLPQRTSSGGASHEICPACGFEPGYTDDDQNILPVQWREQWVTGGCQWFSKSKARPKVWNPVKELHSLLKRKRPVHPPVVLRKEAAPAAPKTSPKSTNPAAKKRPKKRG
jgi:hypothetical protein